MTLHRVFMDTVFIAALLNRRDRYHSEVASLWPAVREAREIWTTEAVLTEVGNAMSALDRLKATQFIDQCYRAANIRVVQVDTQLFRRALDLYASRPDKQWGVTDCVSFTVMGENGLVDALTADRHFIQAGYRSLLNQG